MLHVYTRKGLIPKDMNLIWDVDAFASLNPIENNEFNRKVIEELEQGKYLDAHSFIDRFGFKLKRSCMSTSSKALMSISSNTDKCINCIEMGMNGYYYLPLIDTGHLYIGNNIDYLNSQFSDYNYNTHNVVRVYIDGEVEEWNLY